MTYRNTNDKLVLRYVHLVFLLGALFLCLPLSFANMASPTTQGTHTGSPYSSSDIDILSETIDITVAKDFLHADYVIRYHIFSPKNAQDVPFYFEVTDEYVPVENSSFLVFLDNQPIQVGSYSNQYFTSAHPTYYDEKTDTTIVFSSQAKYFTVDLQAGTHTIEVRYSAKPEVYHGDLIKEYTYRYALKPAKTWHSFNKLTINLSVNDKFKNFSTNLPASDTLTSLTASPSITRTSPPTANSATLSPSLHNKPQMQWQFSDIPVDEMTFVFTPNIPILAEWMMKFDGVLTFLVVFAILFIIHYKIMRHAHRTHRKRPWLFWLLGGLGVPLVALSCIVWRLMLIEWVIGLHAGRVINAYILLFVFIGYLVLMPIYLILSKIGDRELHKKYD